MTIPISLSTIAVLLIVLIIPFFIRIESRIYELPASLDSAQQLFRYEFQNSIYIPSVFEKKVSRLSDYLRLKARYGGLLQEFEQPKQLAIPYLSQEDPPGMVFFPDTEKIRDSLFYVALPAYIAGSNEAGFSIQHGYEFEIAGVRLGEHEQILGSTIVSIDGFPPTLEKVKEIVASKNLHQIKGRTDYGEVILLDTSLYGVTVNAHYAINEIWKFNDLMKFDLANIKGDSGGAATAYEVFLKKKEIQNKHGEFVITGAIDTEGEITSVGGVKAKTYLSIKNSVPLMFVPNGMNYSEAIEMKSLMKSNIDIVPIQKLGDIEAYWK